MIERVSTSLGELTEATAEFKPVNDLPNGGVLLAIPALLSCGLLEHIKKFFRLPNGFYGIDSIFLLLAFMALSRIKSIEQLRYCPPGEWGKLLGLDRIPEVKTLRDKINYLAKDGNPNGWSALLCSDWMNNAPEQASAFYIDGHVRVYNGSQTKLPRHHVSRQKLCLRATTDYWVNAMDGQPFFMVNKAVDPGLINVLENEIIPVLEKDAPNQPRQFELDQNSLIHKFIVIFDREGYSPDFFSRMKTKRIACISYHKFPGENWDEDEFIPQEVTLVSGNKVTMKLAERGTLLSNKLWVREVRKLNESGHQTAIIATDYCSVLTLIAVAMFARWTQENFFKYMRQHYGLDSLVSHAVEDIPESTVVVNPAHRTIDGKVRKKVSLLSRKEAKYGQITFNEDIEPKNAQKYEDKKTVLQEEIVDLRQDVDALKLERKGTPKHIEMSELPEDDKFKQLATQSKHLLDTIKMIAYRAETAMVHVLREVMTRDNDAHSMARSVYSTEADLIPNILDETLTVSLHHQANQNTDNVLSHLCDELNATETIFPGTNLRLIYKVGS